MQSYIQRAHIDAKMFAPFGHTHRFAVKSQQAIASGVPALLLWRCPAAVGSFVVAVVINAINAVLRARPRTHVLTKRSKRLSPTVADDNAASTVVGIACMGFRMASFAHVLPCEILRRPDHVMMAISHDDTSNIRLARTARQRQLLGRSHFTRMFSSGAMCTCTSL